MAFRAPPRHAREGGYPDQKIKVIFDVIIFLRNWIPDQVRNDEGALEMTGGGGMTKDGAVE